MLRWYENGRRRATTFLGERHDAERLLKQILNEVEHDRTGLPLDDRGALTLAELATEWLARRERTHRAAGDDRRRWEKHLRPLLGSMKPNEVTQADVREVVERALGRGLAPGTVGVCVRVLSAFYSDLVERGLARTNPCRGLPGATRRLFKVHHNPEDTPFVEKLEDVRRIYLALPEPVNVAFALGAMAGLRSGEVLALRWESVDLAHRRIEVRASADKDSGEERAPKSGRKRFVPIMDGLLPVLTEWKLKTGGRGLLVPPAVETCRGKPSKHLSRQSLWDGLRGALKDLGFPREAWTPGTDKTLTWYRATRHTFASQWVLANGSMAKLSKLLGHKSVVITERHYVHLRRDAYTDADRATIPLDLRGGGAGFTVSASKNGNSLGTASRPTR